MVSGIKQLELKVESVAGVFGGLMYMCACVFVERFIFLNAFILTLCWFLLGTVTV